MGYMTRQSSDTEQGSSDEWSRSALYRDPTAPTDQRQGLETEAERGFHRDVLTSDPTAPVDSPTTPSDYSPRARSAPAVPAPVRVAPRVATPAGPPGVWEGQSHQRGQNQQGPSAHQGQAGQRGQNQPSQNQPGRDQPSRATPREDPYQYAGPVRESRAARRAATGPTSTGPTARPRASRAWLWVAVPVVVVLLLILANSPALRP